MAMIAFILLAALLIAFSAGTVWLSNPRHAAYSLIGALVTGAGLAAWLGAEFLALAILLGLAGGTALLYLAGLPLLERLGTLAKGRPDEDRSFWAGIVSVLFFVITYRILATAPWGTEDRSTLALTEAQRGLAALSTLGQTMRNEYALALTAGAVLVGVAVAVAVALGQREADA